MAFVPAAPPRNLTDHLDSVLQSRILERAAATGAVPVQLAAPPPLQQQQRPSDQQILPFVRPMTTASLYQQQQQQPRRQFAPAPVAVPPPPQLEPVATTGVATSDKVRDWFGRILVTLQDRRFWPFYIGVGVGLLAAVLLCIRRPSFVEEPNSVPYYNGRLRKRAVLGWSVVAALLTWLLPYVCQHIAVSINSSGDG